MSQHAVNTNTCERFDGLQNKTKRIGNLDFDTASHCIYHLAVHLVFCAKFRRKILSDLGFLRSTLSDVARGLDCVVIEFGGESDHIHFLLRYPPTANLSAVVGTLKAKSASIMLDKLGSFFWGRHTRTLWSSGFFLCSVGGATLEILKTYIEQQGTR
jgi:putative transposase